jgi:hypothetical protein
LRPDQWEEAIELLENNLGLTDQPRIVVERETTGRSLRHVVWLRVDIDKGKAISDSLNPLKQARTGRELERRFAADRVMIYGGSPD